jgi:hypothetical protein
LFLGHCNGSGRWYITKIRTKICPIGWNYGAVVTVIGISKTTNTATIVVDSVRVIIGNIISKRN